MKNSGNTEAISQIIGEIFLLAIAVTAVSVLFTQVLSVPGPQDTTEVTIIGKIEMEHPYFEIQRGEPLGPDSTIKIIINNRTEDINAPPQPLSNYLGNSKWSIGDQIINKTEFVYDPVNPPQVKATIVDTKTNAIVFWGILQEGLTTGHRGGIWHLDETAWIINQFDVKDSSGNKNNGTAKNGAHPQSEMAIHANAGEFNGYSDHVIVNTSWALNITDTITIEAWMQPQPLKAMDNFTSIPLKFGYTPYIIPAINDIYVIVSEDQGKGAKIATIKIEPYGNMTIINTSKFGGSTSNELLNPIITKMTEKIYLVAYTHKDYFIRLLTFNISNTGEIFLVDEHVLEHQSSRNDPNRISLQKINTNHCAIAYWIPSIGGILRNVTIDSNGNITQVGNIIRFDPVAGYEPFLLNVTGDVFALAYRGALYHGILKTYNITTNGNITFTGKMLEFDITGGFEPSLVHISGDIFGIAYRNILKYGIVKTFKISSTGSITLTGELQIFEPSTCYNPHIIHGEKDIYVIAFATGNIGNPLGYATTLQIFQNGSIGTVLTKRQFKYSDENKIETTCFIPIIWHISEDMFVVSYTGKNHEGVVIKIFIPQARFPSDKGITKPDSFGIYATTNRVWGSINNINVSDTISPGWHHFALTFDGDKIRLYVDGNLNSNCIKDVSFTKINTTKNDLYFGRYYSGYIDEIGIYDEALDQDEIEDHYNQPGEFIHYHFN